MILAFGFGLAAQVLMGAATAAPMPASTIGVTAMAGCPGCAVGDKAAPAGGCLVAYCWTMVAVPVQGIGVGRIAPLAFVVGHYDLHPGLLSGPDPYPPKSSLSI